MAARQTREQSRLKHFRMLLPGEIDHEIAADQLITPPTPVWDTPTLTACASLYDRYVKSENNTFVPDQVFCDLPRWVFLEYLVQFCDLLVGSNNPNLARLEPLVLSQNVYGWNLPHYYAFSNSNDALYHAIFDLPRLNELDCTMKSTMTMRCAVSTGQQKWGHYFGIDYRALPHAPWCSGTVYLYKRADFSPDFQTVPYLTSDPILPLARIQVNPWDWPLLDRVHGVDVVAQTERQQETFCGYPWTDDIGIHPNLRRRPLVEQARRYLETCYADPIDLTHLGQQVGLSPFTLLRIFRAHVGLSPREYQTQLRITQAKHLLRQGLPIAHVAAETGFCDQTHLTRHFRQIVGMTPGSYLRMQESPIQRLNSSIQ